MKLPNKFWFYDKSDSSEIFFARKIGDYYTITVPNKESCVHFEDEVEECFNLGLFVLTVPDKFCVRGTVLDKEFSASEYHDGSFVLKDKAGGGSYFFGREEVLTNLYDIPPRWEIVEDASVKPIQTNLVKKPAKKPAKKLISINVNDVRSAAEFDVANNPHTIRRSHSVKEIENEIVGYIMPMYERLMSGELEWEYHSVGTRSYTVSFQPDDEQYGIISVLVNPSIGKVMFFADVNDFLSQN